MELRNGNILVKWNPSKRFHPDASKTIKFHCEILKKYINDQNNRFVWWGKVNKSGKLGLTDNVVKQINEELKLQKEKHLYIYCPDSVNPTLHVANLKEISFEDYLHDPHTPSYYKELNYKVAYWFKITDIRKISISCIDKLLNENGDYFDPVSSYNTFPAIVFEPYSPVYFDKDLYFLCEMEDYIMRCFKTGSTCGMQNEITVDPKSIFIGMPFNKKHKNFYKHAIKPALESMGLTPWVANEVFTTIDIMCKICRAIQSCKMAIIDISGWNANVLFELGLVYGLSKEALILLAEGEKVPVDLAGIQYLKYDFDDYSDLQENLQKHLNNKK